MTTKVLPQIAAAARHAKTSAGQIVNWGVVKAVRANPVIGTPVRPFGQSGQGRGVIGITTYLADVEIVGHNGRTTILKNCICSVPVQEGHVVNVMLSDGNSTLGTHIIGHSAPVNIQEVYILKDSETSGFITADTDKDNSIVVDITTKSSLTELTKFISTKRLMNFHCFFSLTGITASVAYPLTGSWAEVYPNMTKRWVYQENVIPAGVERIRVTLQLQAKPVDSDDENEIIGSTINPSSFEIPLVARELTKRGLLFAEQNDKPASSPRAIGDLEGQLLGNCNVSFNFTRQISLPQLLGKKTFAVDVGREYELQMKIGGILLPRNGRPNPEVVSNIKIGNVGLVLYERGYPSGNQ